MQIHFVTALVEDHGRNKHFDLSPEFSANLSNQFEWPLFFHIACLALMAIGPSDGAIWLAWMFIVGRILHSAVQILTGNVRLRGLVFTINFVAVLGLWALLVMAAIRAPLA